MNHGNWYLQNMPVTAIDEANLNDYLRFADYNIQHIDECQPIIHPVNNLRGNILSSTEAINHDAKILNEMFNAIKLVEITEKASEGEFNVYDEVLVPKDVRMAGGGHYEYRLGNDKLNITIGGEEGRKFADYLIEQSAISKYHEGVKKALREKKNF